MKKILITGSDSYIGTSFETWLGQAQFSENYQIHTVDMRDNSWKNKDFTPYDTVFHVAGIVHKKADKGLYDAVNHILAVETLKKAVESNVRQFLFMSTGAVFSQNDKKHKNIVVDSEKNYHPLTEYGKSKRRAEIDMLKLMHELDEGNKNHTKLAIIRPPMIYGPGAKGNYSLLAKVATSLPFFPDIKNRRSMLYIDNLCELLRLVIDKEGQGYFYPQNRDYVCTSELVGKIARQHGRKIRLVRLFNPIIFLACNRVNFINKVFGDFIFDKELSGHYGWNYAGIDLDQSIALTENGRTV